MASLIRNWKFGFPIYSIAITPAGNSVAVSHGLSVVIWDMVTCKMILGPLSGHNRSVKSLRFSSDGCRIVTGSFDYTVRTWDAITGKALLGPLQGHTDPVNSVVFSNNGQLLISGSDDGDVRIWDAQNGQPVGAPIHADRAVYSVIVPSDDSKIIGAYSDGRIIAYDLITRAILFQCVGHDMIVTSLALSPDGRCFASTSFDDTVRIWDSKTGENIRGPIKGYTSNVRCAVFSPDGRYLAAGSSDLTARIWNLDTHALHEGPLRGHNASVWAIAFTPDGSCLVSGSEDCRLRVWDVRASRARAETTKKYISMEIQDFDPEISSTMTVDEIVSHLSVRGCNDMTRELNMSSCSEYPVSSGGFGDIYKCQLKNGTVIAIKTIRLQIGPDEQNQSSLKTAARELYTWSKCRHPNVQPLLGLITFRGQIGMIAKWELNGNLPQYIKLHPEVDRCVMSTKVTEGLQYLHESGVIHGDLKGANILIAQDGAPQLADFGNATLLEYTLQFTSTSTKSNISYRWAAPELFRGKKCSFEADIYALGMEIFTAEAPWIGKSDPNIMYLVLFEKAHPARPEEHIPRGSDHGDTVWSLLQSCWEFEPEKRPDAGHVKEIMTSITKDGLKQT